MEQAENIKNKHKKEMTLFKCVTLIYCAFIYRPYNKDARQLEQLNYTPYCFPHEKSVVAK